MLKKHILNKIHALLFIIFASFLLTYNILSYSDTLSYNFTTYRQTHYVFYYTKQSYQQNQKIIQQCNFIQSILENQKNFCFFCKELRTDSFCHSQYKYRACTDCYQKQDDKALYTSDLDFTTILQTTYTSLNQVAIQSLDTQIAIKLQQLHTTIYVNSNNLLQHERKISSGFKDISIQPNPNHCMAIDTDQSTTDTDTIPNSQAPLMIEPIETQNTIKTGDMDTLDHIETHLTPHTILTIDHMTFVFTESKNKVYITIYLNKQQMSSEEMKGNRIINITLNESKKNIIIITNEQFRYHITNIALKDNIPCAKTIFLDNPQPLDLTTSFSLEDNLVMITLQESNKIACYLYNLADFNETTLMLENTQTFASKPSINAFTLYAIDNNSYILKKHTISFSYGQFNIQSVDIHALPAHLHKTYILSLHPTSEMFIISNCEQTLLTTIAILEKNLIAPILYKIELSSPMKLGDLSCFIPSKNTLIQCNPTGYSIITDFGEKPAQATCALKLKDDSFIKTLQFDQTRQRLIVISESDSHTHTHYYNINHLMIYHEGI